MVGLVLVFTRGPAGASKDTSLRYTACGANCGALGSAAWPLLAAGISSTMMSDPLSHSNN
jgi:hypothetical protein